MESVWLEAECSRYEFFLDVIAQSNPDVVVVSLDSDQIKALPDRPADAGGAAVPILAISARGDGQAILQALRNGAREFLTVPVVLEDLLKALQRLQRGRPNGEGGSSESPVRGRVASRRHPRLARRRRLHQPRRQPRRHPGPGPEHSVALIDLDLALGDADVALDLMADYTLADVALNIERLDMHFLRRSLSKHASGLSLLPHPVQMEDVSLIREDHLQRVIGLLRASYTHLVLDLSKSFSPTDVTALRMADVILLVAQLELSSLRNVVRMLLTLGADESLADKVQDRPQPRRQRQRHHPEEGRGDHRQADLLAGAQRRQADDRVAQPRRAAVAARAQEQGAAELSPAWPRPCPANSCNRPSRTRPVDGPCSRDAERQNSRRAGASAPCSEATGG